MAASLVQMAPRDRLAEQNLSFEAISESLKKMVLEVAKERHVSARQFLNELVLPFPSGVRDRFLTHTDFTDEAAVTKFFNSLRRYNECIPHFYLALEKMRLKPTGARWSYKDLAEYVNGLEQPVPSPAPMMPAPAVQEAPAVDQVALLLGENMTLRRQLQAANTRAQAAEAEVARVNQVCTELAQQLKRLHEKGHW